MSLEPPGKLLEPIRLHRRVPSIEDLVMVDHRPPPKPRYFLAAALFLVALLTSTTLGAVWYVATQTRMSTSLNPWLGPGTATEVWSDGGLLALGFSFSLPVLFILLCHELGHYLACRYYRLPATLPYFIPAPFGFGTLGAFIRIKAPIRRKKELLDVGIAGPVAGFLALIPFLLYGIAQSEPVKVLEDPEGSALLVVPGKSLAMYLTTALFHGQLGEGVVLDLHPFALAAWVGLLATGLNLLPLSQLDGGHILYAAIGPLQRRLALPLWASLAVGAFFSQAWFVVCALTLLLGLRHPPVADEGQPLDRIRRRRAVLALLLFVLCFMPVPLALIPVE